MEERVIVSFTSYGVRLNNIPAVLDTIFSQTIKPDHIILNISCDESIPNNVQDYLFIHNVEINTVPDTKVYKKLVPTLKKYPKDIIISIDDDWLYPKGMIEDFLDIHAKYPLNPISGNRSVYGEMICHCGCASLTKADYFGSYLNEIEKVINYCPSDDIAYTYFANKAGYPYILTTEVYYDNMTSYNEGTGYSKSIGNDSISKSLSYLIKTYGAIPCFTDAYILDPYISNIIHHIHNISKKEIIEKTRQNTIQEIKYTYAYRIGNRIITPLRKIYNTFLGMKKRLF